MVFMCTKYIINILKKSQQNPPHYQDYSTASLKFKFIVL